MRLRFLPYLLFSLILIGCGLYWLSFVANNVWPIRITLTGEEFAALQRSVVLGQGQVALLMQASSGVAILAFLAGVLAVGMGVSLLPLYALNRRLNRPRPNQQAVPLRMWMLLRQSLLVGVWSAFCTWLQMNRALGVIVAALVALALGLVELLFQLRWRQSEEERLATQRRPVRDLRAP